MAYCDYEKLKLAVVFLDREIQKECGRIEGMRELEEQAQKEEARLQELQKKKSALAKEREKAALTREMFAFGGEALALKDPVAREMKEVEQEIKACHARLRELEERGLPTEEERSFLAMARALGKQAEELWIRKLIPKEELAGAGAPLLLQAKGVAIKSCMSIWSPAWYQRALEVIESYWDSFGGRAGESLEREAGAALEDPSKAAFRSIAPHLMLKLAVERAVEGDLAGLKSWGDRLKVGLEGLSLEYSPYPALTPFVWMEGQAFLDREAFLFLGDCYGYSDPRKRGEKASFAEKWILAFGRAMEDDEVSRGFGEALKEGFSVFLWCYGGKEQKCLGDALKKWKGWRHRKGFARYEEDFRKTLSQYMQTSQYIQRAIEALWGSPEKYPFLPGAADRRGGVQRQTQLRVLSLCREEFLKDWLALDLNPANWKPAWVERCARELLESQRKL